MAGREPTRDEREAAARVAGTAFAVMAIADPGSPLGRDFFASAIGRWVAAGDGVPPGVGLDCLERRVAQAIADHADAAYARGVAECAKRGEVLASELRRYARSAEVLSDGSSVLGLVAMTVGDVDNALAAYDRAKVVM